MSNDLIPGQLQQHAIPGRVTITNENGGLPKVNVTTAFSTAEICLHGAHITHFQKNSEPPLLFLSQLSQFTEDKPIRGGVPIIFPWFGPRTGAGMHGFARLVAWELGSTEVTADGGVKLVFNLPEAVVRSNGLNARVSYVVTVNERLTMELGVTNLSGTDDFSFETCLHTYFAIGDIGLTSIAGLKGRSFLDKVYNFALKTETWDVLWICSEVDRVYLDTTDTVEIRDTKLNRTIRIEKSGSNSTVVWNPWIEKAKAMADFGDEEFRQMVCVESGNVGQNKITLSPGKAAAMKVVLSSRKS
ncbi:MAG TPA: D-hexose-6-phosphate mutarotase [Verrucomicrobiae bacterium]|nr:D-hexose-6-phosphate mutarotase [Verrucomicrobiae bacterium]